MSSSMTTQQFRAHAGKARAQALGRLKAGAMNKTESAYAEHLKAAQIAGEVEAWWFEGIGLKVAAKCHYYPDFMVLFPDGRIEIHEVKARNSAGGYRAEDDAKVKLRPTIILSNLTTEEIRAYLGDRVYDRLRENGGKAFVFDWDSYRGKAA